MNSLDAIPEDFGLAESWANAVLAQGAPIEKDVRDALRQVAQSARALALLADYLERHPESLIRGKPDDPRSMTKSSALPLAGEAAISTEPAHGP